MALWRCVVLLLLVSSYLPGSSSWKTFWNLYEKEEANEAAEADNSTSPWLIFPGTKWCGSGSVAEDYDDLGSESDTDKCCRKHDNCPDLIEAGQTKHGLTNTASYTRLHCDCDLEFRKCLRNTNTKTSNTVGVTYFDVLDTQCYREEYPTTCIQYSVLIPNRCISYGLDKSKPKEWQWFDVPPYYYGGSEEN